ncbi:MAG: glucosaminidase domain-containing protein [Saprospiraceae bacterium]|nr:glucosaminidase domain-containing protein [Saprospiraceae bacterium]
MQQAFKYIAIAAVLLVFFLLLSFDNIAFYFSVGNPTSGFYYEQPSSINSSSQFTNNPEIQSGIWWEDIRDRQSDIRYALNLANEATAVGAALNEAQQKEALKYSNLGLILNPEYAQRHNIDPTIVEYKKKKCLNYIKKYKDIAQEEAQLFNIPASITLAQGLLESNAGDSQLAKKENNHFGIKCKKKCIGCRCVNYTDDTRYDMFRVFETPWFSFREHSKVLLKKRYKHLFDLPKHDYKNWAKGLQAAGYATDSSYGKKLIKIVEAFELDQYDKEG